MIEVEWTGQWPCLCMGEWIIKYDGVELNIPEDLKTNPMYTYGSYVYKSLSDGFEKSDFYFDGLEEDSWCTVNKGWLKKMFKEIDVVLTEDMLHELYQKINAEDFRTGSCGGCL